MGQNQTKLAKTMADHPFKLIESPPHRTGKTYPRWGAMAFAIEMCIVHNHLIRILNSIYLQAPHVTNPADIQDFITYMHSFTMLIHEHHGHEEELFFPWIEEELGIPGYMNPNVEQHHAFGPGLHEFEDYVKGLKEGKVVYDGVKVRAIIDGFGEVLATHLTEEITFLEGMEEFGDKINWESVMKRISKYAVDNANTEFVLPIMLTNGDNTWEKGIHDAYWPPFPWFVGLIFKYVYVPKHKGVWRFSSADSNGTPRKLMFLGDEVEGVKK